jgi:pyrophosphatase PpaX
MKRYTYILLDWDGNLARTLDLWLQACKVILSQEGFAPSDEEIASSFGKIDEYFASLGMADPQAVFDRVDQLGRQKLPEVELYPDALEVLERLKGMQKKTALITASERGNIQHLLDKYDMHPLFDAVVTRDEVAHHKPHPEPLLKGLERLGGNPAEAVMIGDSDKDIGAATNAGMDSILFYPPEHAKFYNLEKLQKLKPTYIVDDFRRVLDIVG